MDTQYKNTTKLEPVLQRQSQESIGKRGAVAAAYLSRVGLRKVSLRGRAFGTCLKWGQRKGGCHRGNKQVHFLASLGAWHLWTPSCLLSTQFLASRRDWPDSRDQMFPIPATLGFSFFGAGSQASGSSFHNIFFWQIFYWSSTRSWALVHRGVGRGILREGVGSRGLLCGDSMWQVLWEDPLEEGMATHSSILAWRIPRTEEPGGLQSMRRLRVRCNKSRTQLKPYIYKLRLDHQESPLKSFCFNLYDMATIHMLTALSLHPRPLLWPHQPPQHLWTPSRVSTCSSRPHPCTDLLFLLSSLKDRDIVRNRWIWSLYCFWHKSCWNPCKFRVG